MLSSFRNRNRLERRFYECPHETTGLETEPASLFDRLKKPACRWREHYH